MLTLNEAKSYLRVDFSDDDALITRLMGVADEYLASALGNYNKNSERADMLALVVIADLYENRELSSKVSANVSRLVQSFILQLQLESRDST